MGARKIMVSVKLPNGKAKQFSIKPDKNWTSSLKNHVQELYPRSSRIQFVEEVWEKSVLSGKTFSSSVMFQVRENMYVLGHITARSVTSTL